MPQMAYVSCLPADRAHADKILDWGRQGLLGSAWTLSASPGAAPAGRGVINVQLRNASALILVVGAGSAESEAVKDEVNHALMNKKRLILVRSPAGGGAAPLQAEGQPLCDFHPARLRQALER